MKVQTERLELKEIQIELEQKVAHLGLGLARSI
jgi:hypothetical protein